MNIVNVYKVLPVGPKNKSFGRTDSISIRESSMDPHVPSAKNTLVLSASEFR